MYRPQSIETSNVGGGRRFYVTSMVGLDVRQASVRENMRIGHHSVNYGRRVAYVNEVPIGSDQRHPMRNRITRGRAYDLDRQVCAVIRQNDLGGVPQSQSFSHGPCLEGRPHPQVPHGSRLSTYMSPPSPHWTTVGNIMAIKRSTSMPGSRPGSTTLSYQMSPQCVHDSQCSTKKKCGPFQCLKYQFRKSSPKTMAVHDDHPQPAKVAANVPMDLQKNSKSMFKKKSVNSSTNIPNSTSKPRGIRKSISLLFSKSSRSSKSDPNIINQKESSSKEQLSYKDVQNICSHSSRRNRSYESMLESDEVRLNNESCKSYSYSDVLESSSMTNTIETMSEETVVDRGSVGEMSMSDSVSICSSEQLISSQNTRYFENVYYKTNDTGWKTVVGNVCRSNSKDSAIANSTFSGDGIFSQSKRISLTSTISRMSDLTSATDDFNDSSYSSFNDLHANIHQLYHPKTRLFSNVTKLKPLHVEDSVLDPPDNSDTSPSSDSSTETLRPVSHLLRRKDFRSVPRVPGSTIQDGSKSMPGKNPCPKRSHSWPGCESHVLQALVIFKSTVLTKPPLPPKRPLKSPSKVSRFPALKMDLHLQKSHLNSSPLLSQYSRLYSLRSSKVKDPIYLVPGHILGSTHSYMSPAKHDPLKSARP